MTYKLKIGSGRSISHLEKELSRNFQWLQERGYALNIKCEDIGKDHYLVITLQGSSDSRFFRVKDIIYIFKYQLAEVLAEEILTFWENDLVRKLVEKKYRRLPEVEKNELLQKALGFLQKCNDNESLNMLMRFGRKNRIARRIFDHLHQTDLLVIDGFINFCLRDYLTEIKFAVELASEEIKNEKEYNEFIKLLRYFVDSQAPRILEVNLMVNDAGLFYMWDGEGNYIEDKYIDYYVDDIVVNNVNLDDILVSILITIAPRRVVLHGPGKVPDNQSLQVIKKVFRDRIFTCGGCERCAGVVPRGQA